MIASSYPTAYAGPARASYEAVVSHARGKPVWAREHSLDFHGKETGLLLLGGDVIVNAGRAFALFDAKGGQRWRKAKREGSPLAIRNDRVYLEGPGLFLQAVDAGGTVVIDQAPFPPLTNREFAVTTLWPREKDFLAITYLAHPKYNEEDLGDRNLDPKTYAQISAYGDPVGAWGASYSGKQSLPPLFVPGPGLLFLSQNQITAVHVETGRQISFALPVERPQGWSADANGNLSVTGYQAGRKTIVFLAPGGEETGRWQEPLHGSASGAFASETGTERDDDFAFPQPPVQAPGGRVWALTRGRVLAFHDGKPAWTYALAREPGRDGGPRPEIDKPAFATALADGSLLFTAGNGLRKLNAEGKLEFLYRAPEAIIAPPVVGADGSIHLLTAGQIIKLE